MAYILAENSNNYNEYNFEKTIGVSLTFGFLLMFVIDQFSKSQAS